MMPLSNGHYSGHHKATKEDSSPLVPGKEVWRKKSEQQVLDTAAERWRQQHNPYS